MDYSDITDLQLAILGVLWARREATIGALHEVLGGRGGATRKTIAVLLARMERRGLVKHRFEGREGVYRAAVTRRKVLVSRIGSMLNAAFATSGGRSAAAAVSADDVRAGDVQRLRRLLRKAARQIGDDA